MAGHSGRLSPAARSQASRRDCRARGPLRAFMPVVLSRIPELVIPPLSMLVIPPLLMVALLPLTPVLPVGLALARLLCHGGGTQQGEQSDGEGEFLHRFLHMK